ncbi:MAG: nitroreductase family protein [Proteobacteria bacterium]|nr:nitroreductase family protein [Pseudomonadota bacterium]
MDDIIKKRRSIRRFQDRPIAAETLADLFEAARYSPSWGNLQCWELVVVRVAEDKKKLASLLSEKNPAGKCTETAPILLGICGDPQKSGYYKGVQVTRYQHWFLYDLGIISQTLCLKAWEQGLGSVIIGSFDHKAAEEVLQVPSGLELVAIIALGYPDHDPPAPKRREVEEFVHYDRFPMP